MLDECYTLRGWSRDGVPKKIVLTELDLSDIAKGLKQR
jgi:aldehyde:ferredoxin oxidoreductase